MTNPGDANPLLGSPISRLWRGIASNGLGQILAVANSIVLVPLFIGAWGTDGYGRWLALTALISYLTLLDLGGQAYVGNLLAEAFAQGDMERFHRYLSEGVSLFLAIAVAAFACLVPILFWPGLGFPGEPQSLNLNERLIILIMAIPILMAIPGGVYVTVYRSTGRFTRGQMIGNVLRGGALLLFILVLALKLSPLSYALATLIQGLVLTSFIVWDIRRSVPASRHLQLNLSQAHAGRRHLGGSITFWIIALAAALNFQGVILVLNAKGSPTDVTLYATHRTAVGLISYIGTLALAPLWPELTFMHARGQQRELARASMLSVKLVSWLAALAACGIWLVMPVLYPLWTKQQLNVDPTLLALLLMQAVLLAGWGTTSWVLMASNQHRRLMWWSLSNAVLTLVLAMLAAPRWGVVGVAAATLTSDVLCGFLVYPRLAARALQIGSARLYAVTIRSAGLLLLFLLATLAFKIGIADATLLWIGVAILVVFLMSTPYVLLDPQERAWIRRLHPRLAKMTDI
jgi:O-antigen/teichoic acid export membrane protein